MNEIDGVKNELKEKAFNEKSYSVGFIIKMLVTIFFLNLLLSRYEYFREHGTTKYLIIVAISAVLAFRILLKMEKLINRDIFKRKNISIEDYKKYKERFINLSKAGHVEKFRFFKEAKKTALAVCPFYLILLVNAYFQHDWSINNVLIVAMILFPIALARMTYTVWLRNETLKMMGYDIDELFKDE